MAVRVSLSACQYLSVSVSVRYRVRNVRVPRNGFPWRPRLCTYPDMEFGGHGLKTEGDANFYAHHAWECGANKCAAWYRERFASDTLPSTSAPEAPSSLASWSLRVYAVWRDADVAEPLRDDHCTPPSRSSTCATPRLGSRRELQLLPPARCSCVCSKRTCTCTLHLDLAFSDDA